MELKRKLGKRLQCSDFLVFHQQTFSNPLLIQSTQSTRKPIGTFVLSMLIQKENFHWKKYLASLRRYPFHHHDDSYNLPNWNNPRKTTSLSAKQLRQLKPHETSFSSTVIEPSCHTFDAWQTLIVDVTNKTCYQIIILVKFMR